MAPFEGGIVDPVRVSDRALTKHAGIPAGSLVEARAVKSFADLCPFEIGQQWVAGKAAAITRYDLGAVVHVYGHWARENGFVKTRERKADDIDQPREPAPEPEPEQTAPAASLPPLDPVEVAEPPSCATCALYGVDWVLGKPRPCFMHQETPPADLDYLGLVGRPNTPDEERARGMRRAA